MATRRFWGLWFWGNAADNVTAGGEVHECGDGAVEKYKKLDLSTFKVPFEKRKRKYCRSHIHGNIKKFISGSRVFSSISLQAHPVAPVTNGLHKFLTWMCLMFSKKSFSGSLSNKTFRSDKESCSNSRTIVESRLRNSFLAIYRKKFIECQLML